MPPQAQQPLFDARTDASTEATGSSQPAHGGVDGRAEPSKDLIPFGKFKGQSLAVLMANADYALWLLNAKAGWLRTSHPSMYSWLLAHFGAPENTPEHNLLQNRFLDSDFRLQLALRLDPALTTEPARNISVDCVQQGWQKWLPKRIARELSALEDGFLFESKAGTQPASQRAYLETTVRAKLERALDATRVAAKVRTTPAGVLWTPVIETTEPKFEVDGADVQFLVAGGLGIEVDEPLPQYGSTDGYAPTLASWGVRTAYRVEVKPFVGDDYPTILRAMVATQCNLLLVEAFQADGASWDQLRMVFASRGIAVVLLDDVLTTEVPISARELLVPPKDRDAMWAAAVAELDRQLQRRDSQLRRAL